MRSSETRNLSIDEPSLPEGTCKETQYWHEFTLITLLKVNVCKLSQNNGEHTRSLSLHTGMTLVIISFTLTVPGNCHTPWLFYNNRDESQYRMLILTNISQYDLSTNVPSLHRAWLNCHNLKYVSRKLTGLTVWSLGSRSIGQSRMDMEVCTK